MRVSGSWLDCPSTQAVLAALTGGGHQALAVGGCVRNALLGVPVTDVDISTDARPERISELAEAAGLRAVPTGVEHGTVTVVADGIGHEVTTFRADMETDGRRAVVRFSDDLREDARRRDFTINALYADAGGRVVDPLDGLPDLKARRIRFIEDATRRIHEDYLRILRFFRFTAWYADPRSGFDEAALDAIARSVDGLDRLSRERVGGEITKLLSAPDPVEAVDVMRRTGVLAHVLPGTETAMLGPLVIAERALELDPDPMRRLAVMGFDDPGRLRLSKASTRRLELFRELSSEPADAAELGYRQGRAPARDVLALRAAILGQPPDPEDIAAVDRGASAQFPVSPGDLMPELSGPALGRTLRHLEDRWIAADFTLDRDALLRIVGRS